jgi:hypothetical protein
MRRGTSWNEEDRDIFAVARTGDHFVCPFHNLQGRSPMEGAGKLGDTELLKCLRRVNLDNFWSRESSTISHNLGKLSRVLQIAHELGMKDPPPMPKRGPWDLKDEFGAGIAVVMVTHFLDPGVSEDTVQYEIVRKLNFAFVNKYHASVENKGKVIIVGKMGRNYSCWGCQSTMDGMNGSRLECTTKWEIRRYKNMAFPNRTWWCYG